MKKILVIEDETIIQETLAEILQLSDYDVILAENGKVGLNKALRSFPDLVLCDMMMPRMNGIDTIKAFRDHNTLKYIPFVFLSALKEMSDVRVGMNLGAEDYLTKPFKTREVLKVIDLQLKKVAKNRKQTEAIVNYRIEKVIEELKTKALENEQKWLDCLRSAGRIQSVILPKESDITALFENNFIYYRPKDIVSGDFYWAQDLGDTKLIAVADCTGHGISASLLTFCCYNGLNLAVKHYGLKEPKEILEKVNELVLNFLKEHGRNNSELGMDILICAINEKEKTLSYAGAKRPLYIITDELKVSEGAVTSSYKQKRGKPLFKIKGSLFTIGSTNRKADLKQHTIQYKTGDQIYLCSDGYADQFGGSLDKCFKSSNLIQLLLSIQNESLKEQKRELVQTFSLWKGTQEQTDDVTVMGIKL